MPWWRSCHKYQKLSELNAPLKVVPNVGKLNRQLRAFSRKVADLPADLELAYPRVEKLRARLSAVDGPSTTNRLKLNLVCNVLLDLHLQGWVISLGRRGIELRER